MSKVGELGCGCQGGIFGWIRVPYARSFYVACVLHDEAYAKGGSEADRLSADRELFWRMVSKSNGSIQRSGRPRKVWWMATVALGYYVAVRVFGRWYFRFKS